MTIRRPAVRRRAVRITAMSAGLLVAMATLPFATVAHADPTVSLDPFILGSAQGVAQAIRLAPGIGSFEAAIAVGTSIAGYDDTEGKASAQNLDLGAVGTSLTGPQCDGSNPSVSSTQIPQPLIAESPDGKTQTKHADLSTDASNLQNTDGSKPGSSSVPASSPADAGVLDVTATGPSGKASTQGNAFSIPGVVSVTGAVTKAAAAVVGGDARDVTSESYVGSVALAGGLVTLGSIDEQVHQRTGAGATTGHSFTIGTATVAGVPLPTAPDELTSTVATINKALAAAGLAITLPTFAKQPDGTATMSPLAIGLANSPVLHQAVAPVVGAAQPVRDALVQQLLSVTCQAGTVFSVGDLFVLGPATGAGSLALLLGGLSATSEGTQYASAFGDFGYLSPGSTSLTTDPGTAGTPGTEGTPGSAGLPAADTGGAAGGTPIASPQVAPTAATSVLGKICDSTHVFRHPGCEGNWGLPVGLASLVVVVGLGYADALAGRGRLRRRGGGQRLDQLKL